MIKKYVLIFAAIICLPLFFMSDLDDYSPRSYKHGWDLGHILIFFFWTYALVNHWSKASKASAFKQWATVLAASFAVGLTIEILQSFTLRSVSLRDLLNDLLGSFLALAFFSPSLKMIVRKKKRAFQISALLLLAISFYPSITSIIDEVTARKQFPILANFETAFETKRWQGKTDIAITRDISENSSHSLRVPLATTKYSGVNLKYFPSDWQGYNYLQLSTYNPIAASLLIHCKIFDQRHTENKYRYEDRYNGEYIMQKGWNKIVINLEEVLNAPRNRKMDLSRIKGLQIFVSSLPEPRVIFIDNVKLLP
ncbi:MAG: VanZ family protein [Proteobacteria bacterium]|nr:VanZ family protein [Pseudomonadota bacterium]